MVLDTSALVAMLLGETEAERMVRAVARDPHRLLSSFALLEAGITMEARLGEEGGRELDLWLHRAGVRIVGLTEAQAEMARAAWRRFGKGRHPARLNIGDCCAYALAKTLDEPLLFKGDDFAKTDVTVATY